MFLFRSVFNDNKLSSIQVRRLVQEYGLQEKYKVFLLTEMPSEVISFQSNQETKPEGSRYSQRTDWQFSKGESQENFRERKRLQWERYASSLVIIKSDCELSPWKIFTVDSAGYANVVAFTIDNKLRNVFKNEVLGKLDEIPKSDDKSFLLEQKYFIEYITQYTGYHPEYNGRMKKGLKPTDIVNKLMRPRRQIHTDCFISIDGKSAPSPLSITTTLSPTKTILTDYAVKPLEETTVDKRDQATGHEDQNEDFSFESITFS